MATAASLPFVPTNAIKTFGAAGPIYEVGLPLRPLPDGDWMIGILLVETGKQAEYRLSHILNDPMAM